MMCIADQHGEAHVPHPACETAN